MALQDISDREERPAYVSFEMRVTEDKAASKAAVPRSTPRRENWFMRSASFWGGRARFWPACVRMLRLAGV